MMLQQVQLLMLMIYMVPLVVSLRETPGDSILDIINTKEVERLLAEKKENITREEKRYLIENELNENYIPPDFEIQRVQLLDGETEVFRKPVDNPRIDIDVFLRRNNHSDPYKNTELLGDLRGYNGIKLLKSSKNALFVTKREYLQKDWCKTEPLIQKIKEEGCLTRTVINRFCYGQCNSFYIPKNPKRKPRKRPVIEDDDEDQNGPAFEACSFCRPKKFTWVTVTLRCPSLTPQFRKKRIQRIKQCKCINVN